MGGLRWLKRVVDHIEEKKAFEIKKVDNNRVIASRINNNRAVLYTLLSLLDDTRDALRAFFTNPDIVILDSYGEANLVLWGLLRFFRPNTRILSVFHHYETTPIFSIEHKEEEANNRVSKLFNMYYNFLIERAFKKMIRTSDAIITVSVSSMRQLYTHCGMTESEIRNKVSIVGASIDPIPIDCDNKRKDIDFLCVGRIDKFKGIENIWGLLKEKNPKSNFVMIGKASKKEIGKFHKLGIDHRGIVSENEKFEIFQRARVFLFPSIREGFGMAVAEAIHMSLPVIAWRIPVFEELYENEKGDDDNPSICKIKRLTLIKSEDYKSFAEEAINTLNSVNTGIVKNIGNTMMYSDILKTWKDVGDKVTNVLERMRCYY
jgi:glycosyltransferase involved in cell wall biosynthesis